MTDSHRKEILIAPSNGIKVRNLSFICACMVEGSISARDRNYSRRSLK